MKLIHSHKKTIWAIIFIFTFSLSTVTAQNDTMYIMKNGLVVGEYNVNTQVDSVIFYKPTIAEATSGTFTDTRDNTVYNWVKIGNKVWMAENLAYLPSVVAPSTGSLTTPYYYVYGYSGTSVTDAKATSNYVTYGVLYNWTAAMASSTSSTANPSRIQGACPTGWHLPSDAEWTDLTDYLGGTSVAGGKLKEAGTAHWTSPNTGATNEIEFTALPAGYRHNAGAFSNIGGAGNWWCATEKDETTAWDRSMSPYNVNVAKSSQSKGLAFSVRCIKD